MDHFLEDAAQSLGKKKPTPPKELLDLLATHPFPGNVRELKAMIFDAVSRHESRILPLQTFKARIRNEPPASARIRDAAPIRDSSLYSSLTRLPTLKDAADLLIDEALKRSGGNITLAAGILGISHQALSKRLKRRSDE